MLLGTWQAAGAGAQSASDSSATSKAMTTQDTTDAAAEAQMRVNDAIAVVGKMKADPHAGELLAKAKGVVLIPDYLQAALGIWRPQRLRTAAGPRQCALERPDRRD